MYWILMSERSDEYELSIDELPPMMETLDLRFDYGNFISKMPPSIDVPYSQHVEERKTDNIVSPTRLGLLINERVKNVFDTLNIENVQYCSAKLIEQDSGEVNDDYFLANIVGKYACVDKDKSELEYFSDGEIEFIDSLALDLDPAVDYGHIFRLAEFPTLIVISTKLKENLEEAAVTGFKIYAPAEFSL